MAIALIWNYREMMNDLLSLPTCTFELMKFDEQQNKLYLIILSGATLGDAPEALFYYKERHNSNNCEQFATPD